MGAASGAAGPVTAAVPAVAAAAVNNGITNSGPDFKICSTTNEGTCTPAGIRPFSSAIRCMSVAVKV